MKKYTIVYGLNTIQKVQVTAANEKDATEEAEKLLNKISEIMKGETTLIEVIVNESDAS